MIKILKVLYDITEKFLNWIEQDKWENPARILFTIAPMFVLMVILLKLLGILTWSWFWFLVLSPLWMVVIFIYFVIVIARINVYLYWKLKK